MHRGRGAPFSRMQQANFLQKQKKRRQKTKEVSNAPIINPEQDLSRN